MKNIERTLNFYNAIRNEDCSHKGVSEVLRKKKELIHNYYNREIAKEVETKKPKLSITKRLLDQFKYSAKKVSRYFKSNSELVGVCTGKIKSDEVKLDNYHIYHDQKCRTAEYTAQATGIMKTNFELYKQGLTTICDAHSHNVMDCKHSSVDERTLQQKVKASDKSYEINVNGNKLLVHYHYNIVFNEKDEPCVKMGIEQPYLGEQGLEHKVVTDYIEYDISDEKCRLSDLKRLKSEIEIRVSFQ